MPACFLHSCVMFDFLLNESQSISDKSLTLHFHFGVEFKAYFRNKMMFLISLPRIVNSAIDFQ